MEPFMGEEQLVSLARGEFERLWPDVVATATSVAPGRVNLMGDHTDYNGGGVLPMALPLVTVMVGGQSGDGTVTVVSTATGLGQSEVSFPAPTPARPLTPGGEDPHWASYVKGVVQGYPEPVPGFRAVIVSAVPLGSGLSSSAALEVATYGLLAQFSPDSLSERERAQVCQRAEREFSGVPCGIMDQLTSFMAQEGRALHIDCSSLAVEPVAVEGASVVVVDSGVRHSLAAGEYAARRAQCEEAARRLGVATLRQVTRAQLEERGECLEEVVRRRARHVVTETERVPLTVAAFRARDLPQVGRLMAASHASLRDEFEVSCAELDQLVQLCSSVAGVVGARMTGGGFGGCVVAVVTGRDPGDEEENVRAVVRHVTENYKGQAKFYLAVPSRGAHSYSLTQPQ